MQSNLTVEDVMTADLMQIGTSTTVEEAQTFLLESGLKVVPVIGDLNDALGIVSLHDITPDIDPKADVTTVMAKPAITIDLKATIGEAAKVMKQEYIHHLIVTEDGSPIGMISTFDMLELI